MTLSQIYEYIIRNVPHFKDKGDSKSSSGWKNSIRHNLSLHSRFQRVPAEDSDFNRSSFWKLNPEAASSSTPRRRSTTSRRKNRTKIQHQLTYSQFQAQCARPKTMPFSNIHHLTSRNADLTLINTTSTFSQSSSSSIAAESNLMNWRRTFIRDADIPAINPDRNFSQNIQFQTELEGQRSSMNCESIPKQTDICIAQNLNSLKRPVFLNPSKNNGSSLNTQTLIPETYNNQENKVNSSMNKNFLTLHTNSSLTFDNNNKNVSCQEQIFRNSGVECFRSAHHLNGGVVTTNTGFSNKFNDISDEISANSQQINFSSSDIKIPLLEKNENDDIIECALNIVEEINGKYTWEKLDDSLIDNRSNMFEHDSGLNSNVIKEIEGRFERSKDKKLSHYDDVDNSIENMIFSLMPNSIESPERKIESEISPEKYSSTFEEKSFNNKMALNFSHQNTLDVSGSLDCIKNDLFYNSEDNKDDLKADDITSQLELWSEDMARNENNGLNNKSPTFINTQDRVDFDIIHSQNGTKNDLNLESNVTFLSCDQEIDKEIENIWLRDCLKTTKPVAETFVPQKLNDTSSINQTARKKENSPEDKTQKCDFEAMKESSLFESLIFEDNDNGKNLKAEDIDREMKKLCEALTDHSNVYKIEDGQHFKTSEILNHNNNLKIKENYDLKNSVLSNISINENIDLFVDLEDLSKETSKSLDPTDLNDSLSELTVITPQNIRHEKSKENEYLPDNSNIQANSDFSNDDCSVNGPEDAYISIRSDPDLNSRNRPFTNIFSPNNPKLSSSSHENNFINNDVNSYNEISNPSNFNITNVSPSRETEWCFASNSLFPEMNLRNEETEQENIGNHSLKISTVGINCSEESQDTIIIDMSDFSSDNEICDFANADNLLNQVLDFNNTFSKDFKIAVASNEDAENKRQNWAVKSTGDNHNGKTSIGKSVGLDFTPENLSTICSEIFDDAHNVMDCSFQDEYNTTVLNDDLELSKNFVGKKVLPNEYKDLINQSKSISKSSNTSTNKYAGFDTDAFLQEPCSSTQNFPFRFEDSEVDCPLELLSNILSELNYKLFNWKLPTTSNTDKYLSQKKFLNFKDYDFDSLIESIYANLNLDYSRLEELKNILESYEMKDNDINDIEGYLNSIRSEESEDSGVFDTDIFTDEDELEELQKRLHSQKK